ncbi:imelysin family protein [Flavobacterium sp. DG1-102-2]|uniref:imelysin family protein n=1 Tax=Flavobacterium sp. DG1-102-2 TaxID=3081663 RepID=UPI00294A7965|nr:imelysin family protein [Flavobacterium sp. DG1-102-2]MDV6169933.1 imelysin family protein [Flavobacterium sp. DG1-102-2]
MKKLTISLLSLAGAGLIIASCSDDDNNDTSRTVTKSEVVANYAKIVYQNYKDAYDDAVELETAINAFTANPTSAGFDTAKTKWKEARESYGTTEAFRFANGPIDDEDGPEGLINAWPLDENYIDYVDDNGTIVNGGIINSTATVEITKEFLSALNEDGGEKNISTGYHAIEFLLWGQDLTAPAEKKAGLRAYTDYLDGSAAINQAKRRQYLNVVADLLTDNLDYLVKQWEEGGEYRTVFLALPVDTALQNIYLGIATLASAELAVERMDVALANMDQEDEHSCFSDNTHRDIYLNFKGIENVYEGEYGNIDGPSLEDLVRQANNQVATDTDKAFDETEDDIEAIAIPFDFAISQGATSTEGAKVKKAVLALQEKLGANLLAGASALGISVTIE